MYRSQERPSVNSSLGIRLKTALTCSLSHLKPVVPATLRLIAAYVALGLFIGFFMFPLAGIVGGAVIGAWLNESK
jgi:hypothetical protein